MELLSELQQNKLRILPATHFKTRCKRKNGFGDCLFHFPDNQPVSGLQGVSTERLCMR